MAVIESVTGERRCARGRCLLVHHVAHVRLRPVEALVLRVGDVVHGLRKTCGGVGSGCDLPDLASGSPSLASSRQSSGALWASADHR